MFLERFFEKKSKLQKFETPLMALLCDEEIEICQDFDLTLIQDSWSWRNVHVGRELAKKLLTGQGEVDLSQLNQSIKILEKNLYSLGPGRHHDGHRQRHLLHILQLFRDQPAYSTALQKITKPVGNLTAEKLIRDTLFIPEKTPIKDLHARQASFSALLTSLRQNVGSCFATAPAIMIQQEQSLRMLEDFSQLFARGRLVRTVEGVESVVPLSLSWGVGDLFRPFPLGKLGVDPLKTLSFAPGLHRAFEGAGILKKGLSREERARGCEELLKRSHCESLVHDSFGYSTPEQILKIVLLHHFKMTERDVKGYQEKVTTPIAGEVLIQRAPLLEAKSSPQQYLKAYKAAKEAFKGVTDNALLKAWEFTLASFAETKADFAKWNIYISLGINPEEPFSIASTLYEKITHEVEKINEDLKQYQSHYDHVFAQIKSLEGRIQRASESEIEWLRGEYQIRRQEMHRVLSEHDEMREKGERLTKIFPFLMNFYGDRIRDYFQEVYDAEMHDVSQNPYDDSPAGFRLLYKHGRPNPALWTLIHTPHEYLQHLTAFFIATEIDLEKRPEIEGLEKELRALITSMIHAIKQPEFLEYSFHRLAKAYHEPLVEDPLNHLELVKRKPWSYVSGGTMGTLTSSYYANPSLPQESKRWVETENELLAYFLDTFKEAPARVQKLYQKEPNRSMLAFTPTHAYLFKPGWKHLREGWEENVYTYTWIRDAWVQPHYVFLEKHLLDGRMMELILQKLIANFPPGYRAIATHAVGLHHNSRKANEFRADVMRAFSYEKWMGKRELEQIGDELDGLLFSMLPLFPEHQLIEKLERIFSEIDPSHTLATQRFYSEIQEMIGKYKILSSLDLRDIAKAIVISALEATRSPIFYHQKILDAMQRLGFAYPAPILFGDTNWVKNVFGFTVNPGTEEVELWRFDECGGEGKPMSAWKRYLNGSDRQEWGLYTSPHQYGQFG